MYYIILPTTKEYNQTFAENMKNEQLLAQTSDKNEVVAARLRSHKKLKTRVERVEKERDEKDEIIEREREKYASKSPSHASYGALAVDGTKLTAPASPLSPPRSRFEEQV